MNETILSNVEAAAVAHKIFKDNIKTEEYKDNNQQTIIKSPLHENNNKPKNGNIVNPLHLKNNNIQTPSQ